MSTYILQKELPNAKAGVEFRLNSSDNYFSPMIMKDGFATTIFTPEEVENNPEWFKLKEEQLLNASCYNIHIPDGIEKVVVFHKGKELKYTEDDMRKCFEFGRTKLETFLFDKEKTFEDYLKEINSLK